MKLTFLILFLIIAKNTISQINIDTINIKEVIIKDSFKDNLEITSKIDKQKLLDNSTNSLSRLIAKNTTLLVKDYGLGSVSTVTFRGTNASHTQVSWNGININSPMLGVADFSLLPSFLFDNVDILYGGSSLKETSGGLGGAIVISNKNTLSKNKIELTQEIGSFSTYGTYLSINLGKKELKSNTRVFFKSSKGDFEFTNTSVIPIENTRMPNSDYLQYGFLQNFNYKLNKTNFVDINIWYQQKDKNIPPILTNLYKQNYTEYQKDNTLRAVGTWKKYYNNITIKAFSGINFLQLDYLLQHHTLLGDVSSVDSKSNSSSSLNGFSVKQREIIKGLSGEFNLNYNYHKADISAFERSEKYDTGFVNTRNELLLMLNSDYKLNNNFLFRFLIRKEFIDNIWSDFTPYFGVFWNAKFKNNILNIRTSLSKNHHFPSLNDLYFVPGGNPNLLPENGFTSDLNLEYIKKTDKLEFKASITGFYSEINNWILWKPTSFGYWTPENVSLVISRGIENYAEIKCQFNKNELLFSGNYSYVLSTNESGINKGKQLIYTPKHKYNILAEYSRDKYKFSWNYLYIGNQYTTSDNSVYPYQLQYFILNDLSISKSFKLKKSILEFSIKANNFFNVAYQSIINRPMPGRNYSLIINFRL